MLTQGNGDIFLPFDGFYAIHAIWCIIYKATEQLFFPIDFEIRDKFALVCFRG